MGEVNLVRMSLLRRHRPRRYLPRYGVGVGPVTHLHCSHAYPGGRRVAHGVRGGKLALYAASECLQGRG
eukprot:5978084-Pyramimonas_sp.AAC.1